MDTIIAIIMGIAAISLIVLLFNLIGFESTKNPYFRHDEDERRRKWLERHRDYYG